MATITSPLMILIRFMTIDSKVYFAEIQSINHSTVIVRPGCEGSLKKKGCYRELRQKDPVSFEDQSFLHMDEHGKHKSCSKDINRLISCGPYLY